MPVNNSPDPKSIKVPDSRSHSTDPVCGMTVATDTPIKAMHGGTEYYFCCGGCLARFQQNPEKYTKSESTEERDHVTHIRHLDETAIHREEPAPDASFTCPMHPEVRANRTDSCPKCGMELEAIVPSLVARTEWTCPMHPEIVRDAPGNCPICGMALEPRTAMTDEEDSPELRDMRRRFWLSTALTVPLVFLAMIHMLPEDPLSSLLPMRTRTLLELALATPVCIWSAWPFYARAVQ